MDWSKVGSWLASNAGTGAALVGGLLTGNLPAAVAAGVSLVAGATGEVDPTKALEKFQTDPTTVVRLRELAAQEEQQIRQHIQEITRLRLEDEQAEQRETQTTIRSGDNSEDIVVRRTRPLQSWLSLVAAIAYVFLCFGFTKPVDTNILMLLLTLPWTYAGLRQIGKGVDMVTQAITVRKQ